jgi:L-seryl-tRNA(Ser) seleniumtransferase
LAVGRSAAIERLRRHPLMRALRPDKITFAALAATLELYRDGRAVAELPIWRMIAARPAALAKRARAIAEQLLAAGVDARAVSTESTIGGGSLPEETQPSHGVAIRTADANELARRLRGSTPPVIGRIIEDEVVLDLRSVLPEDDARLASAVSRAGERAR